MSLQQEAPGDTKLQWHSGYKPSKKGLKKRVPSNLVLESRWEDISLEERPDIDARKQDLLTSWCLVPTSSQADTQTRAESSLL